MEKIKITSINENFSLNIEDVSLFKERGFILLKNFFTKEMMCLLKEKIDAHLSSPTDKYQTGFNRVKYDIFEDDPDVGQIFENKIFRSTISKLAGMELLHTQTLAFELMKKVSQGFPWHIGTQSFGFQRAEDFACTLWIPMVEIDNSAQKGGMSYVPKNNISGEFMYNFVDPSSFRFLQESIDAGDPITLDEFIELRDGPLNQPAMKRLLDYYAVTDDFELGDALLFDKYVIHKSVMLEDGPIDSRAALAIRFIDSSSKYDKKRADDLEIPRKLFDYKGPTRFHLDVAEFDGQLISEGPFYKGKIHRFIS